MEIKKVYTTSRGKFWNLAEAQKKTNRAKAYGSRPGDPVTYEPVEERYVLTDGDNVFALNPVEIE